MKQKYERTVFTVTPFDEEDVITTSATDTNNAFQDMQGMIDNDAGARPLP